MQKVLLAMVLASLSGMSYAACNTSNIISTAPNSRYQLLNNNTEVKDLKTNLIWQRCSLGQTWSGVSCTGTATTHTWQNAMQASQNIGGGWRLPNIKELQSLVERACYNPSINETIFPNTVSQSYWSSSPVAGSSGSAWIVYFYYGYDYYGGKNYNYTVRLVRSSQ